MVKLSDYCIKLSPYVCNDFWCIVKDGTAKGIDKKESGAKDELAHYNNKIIMTSYIIIL